ncbi:MULTISPECIES: serine hydrolase domain-containing protein [unclassified Crossiella]|uniref:serine hydrolase domain-containing protein n=1 Tax=unclassified Crossiella TaxID=2620835 RepID=UPI001FFF0BDB|nr:MULTISPECIES: serine hydrolase domain-containing protein [unclassified Crossiella]MCK2238820.1 beta-lactamase family protein [Crossiella sp. S99.2]MCK2251610.1 beta-lactamase family protein [Crossiella sp. S99.1]
MRSTPRRLAALLLTFVSLTVALPGTAVAGVRPELQRELDGMVAAGVPGVVLTVRDGDRVHRAKAGVADLDTGAPLPADGRFRIASLTKPLVATVLLGLVHEGRLALTDTLGHRLPGVVPGGDGIRIEQLLHNTSGLTDYTAAPEFADPAVYTQRHHSPAALVRAANALGHGPPGAWKYSNTNYILLGMIIERATGDTLDNQLRQRVFRPAGMHASELPRHPRLWGPHASGHYRIDPGPRVELTELDPSFAWAAYGVVSTAGDLQRFHTALHSGVLLPPGLAERMRTDAVATTNPVWPRYGLGIEEMSTTCGVRLWGHTGAIPGYSTMAFATADARRQVILSSSLFSPKDGKQVLHMVNVINWEFCGEPWRPPS